MTEISVIRPQEGRQWDFVASTADEAFYLGKAGGGKSLALLMDYLYDIDKPLHNGIIFRKRYQDLEDLIHKAHQIYPALGGVYSAQKHLWTFPSGARLWMTYLERDTDVYSWLGWEFTWIAWDELPQFGKMPYLFMFSRLRCADPTIHKRVRSTGNMDGPGIGWVIQRSQKSLKEGEIGYFTIDESGRDLPSDKENGVSRQWFFSERAENKFLDSSYEKNLDLLPTERLKKAYKDGIYETYDEPDQLIKTEWVEAALAGLVDFQDGPKSFGTDYAELGNDLSVEVFGVGNQPQTVQEWDYLSHPEMARHIADTFDRHGLYQIRGGLDTIGTGAGVHTSLAEINQVMANRTNPIRYKDPFLDKKWEMAAVKMIFRNIQDQVLWKLREDFEFGRIDLSVLAVSGYGNLDKLKEELLAPYFRIQNGEVWISSSNDLRRTQRPDGRPSLGRSPDRLKAFAIWNYAREWTPPQISSPINRDVDYGGEAHRRELRKQSKRKAVSFYV